MAINPQFADNPIFLHTRLTAANPDQSGASGTINWFNKPDGTPYTVPVSGVKGLRVNLVTGKSAQPSVSTNTAKKIILFMKDTAGNIRHLDERAVAAVAGSLTVVGASVVFSNLADNGLDIPPGCQIGVTQTVYTDARDQMDFVLRGGEYSA